MNPVFDDDCMRELLASLAPAFRAAEEASATPAGRQPVHTMYGGAHLFADDTIPRMGAAARRTLAEYAPDWVIFARAIGLAGAERLPSLPAQRARLEEAIAADPAAVRASEPAALVAHTVYARVLAKLEREPVEDYRIDFEDGYGVREPAEESAHALAAGAALARAHVAGTLSPFSGLRIPALSSAHAERAARLLERFMGALLAGTNGSLPANFVVTLPKVAHPAEVEALALLLARLERAHGLAAGAIRCELMLETPQALVGPDGRVPLAALVAAAAGRCRGVHVGVYDYTAALGVAAADQSLAHPAAALARQLAQAALAGSGVMLSDGALARLPLAPHRTPEGGALTPVQREANRAAVHGAWRAHVEAVRRALREGFAQGWDLHPAQLPTRHAAVIAHALEGLDDATARLRAFVDRAARAGAHGGTMDDAATGLGLLNFFARGLASGALTDADVRATGLTPDELRSRDFVRIVTARTKH